MKLEVAVGSLVVSGATTLLNARVFPSAPSFGGGRGSVYLNDCAG